MKDLFLKYTLIISTMVLFSTVSNANGAAKIYQHLQKENGLSKKKVSFLFVQKAGIINLSKQKGNCYSMQLSQLGKSLLYFSDRPARIVGYISTAEFVSVWNKNKTYPNATVQGLTVQNGVKKPFISVITFSNPRFDKAAGRLYYHGCITDKTVEKSNLPLKIFDATLFIDNYQPWNGG